MRKKTAVVVGATGNIGSKVVNTLTDLGYFVDPTWLTDQRPDATKESSYENLPEIIDFAIYIPGLNVIKPVVELLDEEWDRVFSVNVKGAFLFAKHAYRALARSGNSGFVTVSSILTSHPYPNRTPYSAAKSALEGLTKSLAVEWGAAGINTHCIRLGHLSGFMKTSPANPLLLNAVVSNTPNGYLLQADDVASYVGWLAQGGIKAVNGATIDFDPGYCINRWPLK